VAGSIIRGRGRRATSPSPARREPVRAGADLRLLGSFELVCNREVAKLPMSAQRLLVFLALQNRPVLRPYVAGMLWLDTSDDRAAANLRAALWRTNRLSRPLVESAGSSIQLAPDVRIDVRERTELAYRLLDDGVDVEDRDLDESQFVSDLLPDWYEDWLVVERERFRQLRLHVLETICERLTAGGRFARALEAALAAVAGEPLRESAHRALMKVHLAEGNRAEALRQYDFYRRLLADQVGLVPSRKMVELLCA
jgi:DNA-binding SARP family transcriptional activator